MLVLSTTSGIARRLQVCQTCVSHNLFATGVLKDKRQKKSEKQPGCHLGTAGRSYWLLHLSGLPQARYGIALDLPEQ